MTDAQQFAAAEDTHLTALEQQAEASVAPAADASTPPAMPVENGDTTDTTSDALEAHEHVCEAGLATTCAPVDEPTASKTYYLFDMIDSEVGIYGGKFVTTHDEQPKNSTTWAPPVPAPGQEIYIYKGLWHAAPARGSKEALERMRNAATQMFTTDSQSLYPEAESATFARQLTVARAYLATGSIDPLLLALSQVRGIDVSEMAQKIVDKNDLLETQQNTALVAYQRRMRQIEAGDTRTLPVRTILGFMA